MKEEIHVMLDLETLGNRINPVLVQISAVTFSFEEEIETKEFDVLVDERSCVEIGLEYSQSTLDWWKEQAPEAQAKVFDPKGRLLIEEALLQFTEFIKELRKEYNTVYLHGNGVRADNVWLLSAFKAAGLDDPVAYNEDLDFRTLHYLAKKKLGYNVKDTIQFEGIPHNAIDDCKFQIACAKAMYNALMGGYL